MKTQIKKMKLQLKELAITIRQQKQLRKAKHPHHDKFIGFCNLERLRYKYRHMHVAYGLVRGLILKQMDSGVGLDMDYVNWLTRACSHESKEKLYVVVSDSLTPSQQAVQSAHAVAEFIKNNPNTLWDNGYLVLLQESPGRHDGNMTCVYGCRAWDSEFAEFKEPDIGNKVTAYACFGPRISPS